MMNFIPFISYRWADAHDMSWSNQLSEQDESRVRLFALAQYKDGDTMCTIEGRVIIENMPDFCGGMIVHSPQVHMFSDARAGWVRDEPRKFVNPGPSPDSMELDITFPALSENPKRAIDLVALLDRDVTHAKAEDFMWQSMAMSVLSYCYGANKRGIIGADSEGGRMEDLVHHIRNFDGELIMAGLPARYGKIKDGNIEGTKEFYTKGKCEKVIRYTEVEDLVFNSLDQYRNNSSGNEVRWLPLQWRHPFDGRYCETMESNCKCHVCKQDTSAHPIHPEIIKCLAERDYVRQVPRNFWRNG